MALNNMSDELIDDSSTDIPALGLNGSLSLKDRFKFRLSRLLNADIVVVEVKDPKSVIVYIKPSADSPSTILKYNKRVQNFTKDIQYAMRGISKSEHESQKEQFSQAQWDVILLYVSQCINKAIKALHQIFSDYKTKFSAMVAQMFALDDVDREGSSFDTTLGCDIVRLKQLVYDYNGTIKQQNEMIELTEGLLHRSLALEVRLKCLLGSTFSGNLYESICHLSQPLRTHHTMVRAASTYAFFQAVEFRLGSPPDSLLRAITTTLQVPIVRQQQPQIRQLDKALSSPSHMIPKHQSIMDIIQPYLPEEDRGHGIIRLQPAQKQAAALLIGSVLSDMRVPVGSEAYHCFGFVTCHNKEEERALGRYYRQFLETDLHPTIVFKSIVKALKFDTLTGLLRNKSRQDLDKAFPALHRFLDSPSEERPSVYRLSQFTRDVDNDEPAPCLKRDYGFKFCTQREHVTKLRELYSMLLDRAEPIRLHDACRFGRLWEFTRETLGHVDPSMRRLLQNDYGHPDVGFDSSRGIEAYMKPLFKRVLRG